MQTALAQIQQAEPDDTNPSTATELDAPPRRTYTWLGWQATEPGFDLSLGPAPERLRSYLGLGLTLLRSPLPTDNAELRVPVATLTEPKRAVLLTRTSAGAPESIMARLADNRSISGGQVEVLRGHMQRAVREAWSSHGHGLQALLAAEVAEPFVGDVLKPRNPLVREVHSRRTDEAVTASAAHDFRLEQSDYFPLLVAFDAIVRQITGQAVGLRRREFRPGWLLGDVTTERTCATMYRGHRIALVNPWWLQALLDDARNNREKFTAATMTIFIEAAFIAGQLMSDSRCHAQAIQDLIVHLAAASAPDVPRMERLLRRALAAHNMLAADKLVKRRTAVAIETTKAAIKAGRRKLPLTHDMLTGIRGLCREQFTLTGLALWAEVADYSAEQLCDIAAAVPPPEAFKAITTYVLRSST